MKHMLNMPLELMETQASRDVFAVEAIDRLVHTFYDSVKADPVLAPIFERRITDWPEHLARMVGFWRALLRGDHTFTPRHRGPPPQLHQQIQELELSHFDRWLALFEVAAHQVFPADAAEHVLERARRIAVPLSSHLAG